MKVYFKGTQGSIQSYVFQVIDANLLIAFVPPSATQGSYNIQVFTTPTSSAISSDTFVLKSSEDASATVAYLHADHLGTPRSATDETGKLVWSSEGYAFGGPSPSEDVDGDSIKTSINLRFPGQYYDAETGLHYNWNRYYSPSLGRYITSDPIGYAGGLHTYNYAGNNPLKYTDPRGLLDPLTQFTFVRKKHIKKK